MLLKFLVLKQIFNDKILGHRIVVSVPFLNECKEEEIWKNWM